VGGNAACVQTDWVKTSDRITTGGGGGGGGGGSIVPSTANTAVPGNTGLTTQSGPQSQSNGDYTGLYRGDIDDSGVIDIFDYNLLMVNWSKTKDLSSQANKVDKCRAGNVADVNCDGKVDILDFNIVMIYWGKKIGNLPQQGN
jgi:hypothetical protein